MKPCIQNSKKICMNCKHYEYCDRANRCIGDCGHCDDATCENNPLYRLKTRKENKDVFYDTAGLVDYRCGRHRHRTV